MIYKTTIIFFGAQKKKILKRNLSYKPIKRRSLKVKIKNKKIKSKILSLTLRKPIIVGNSGLNDSVEKMKAASQVGPNVSEVLSALYRNGVGFIGQMFEDVKRWMQHENYSNPEVSTLLHTNAYSL